MDNTSSCTRISSTSTGISAAFWSCIEYYVPNAIMPFFLFSALVASLILVRVFMSKRMQLKISSTSRLYYLTIAISITGSILLNRVNVFVLTNLGLIFPAIRCIDEYLLQITILCDFLRISSVLFPHCIGWFYLLLELSYLIKFLNPEAVCSKFLLQCRHIHVVLLSLVVIIGLLISAVFVIAHHFFNSSSNCMIDLDDFIDHRTFRYILATDISIGPYILTLAVSMFLLRIIQRRAIINLHTINCHDNTGRNSSNFVSHTKLAYGIVAVMLSLAHFATNFPIGICYSFYGYFIAHPNSSQELAEIFGTLYVVLSPLDNLDALIDFIIYTVRIPSFKTFLFGKTL